MARTITEATNDLLAACLPCELAADTETFQEETESGEVQWSGVIALEGVMTGDGRLIEHNALRWDTLPMAIRYVSEDVGAHDGAQVVGHILTMERMEDGRIWATGDFDMESKVGREAARQVHKKLTNGVSVDLDDVSFQVRVAKDLIQEDEEEPVMEEDEEGRVVVADIDSDSEVMVTDDARIRAATIVAVPAFEQARIFIEGDVPEADDEIEDEDEIVASASSSNPPSEWFGDPGLTGPTHLTVTDEGRIYGHLATWETCHIGYQGQCITPPHSESGYGYFRTGSVLTSDGQEIPTGVITLDTLHAGKNLSAADTLAHYENTGRGVCDVAAGEDQFGIWVAGSVRPGITPEQVRILRASAISGDWRRIGGKLELVAALSVNVPGFPIPRPQGMVAGGAMTSLVASGIVPPDMVITPGQPGALSLDDLKYLKQLADRERQRTAVKPEVEKMARQLRAEELAKEVNDGV